MGKFLMNVQEHFKKMLVTIGWFSTGALIATISCCLYDFLIGMLVG
jgi:hypothetical protein